MRDEFGRYLVTTHERLTAMALWAAMAHLLNKPRLNINVSPRLAFQAPTKGSGKTLGLELMDNVSPNAVMAAVISTSAVFRTIDEARPTLLIDEADNVLHRNSNPELLAVLNSGHRRKSAFVLKTEPDANGGSLTR